MDPEIQRAIEEIQFELRELIQVMRSLGNVMSAIGDQEIKAFGRKLDAAGKDVQEFGDQVEGASSKVKKFTGLVDKNGNVIRSETEAREEAAEATRELTLEERRRRAEEFVYRRSQRSAFRDLTTELSTTRGATARLQEGLLKNVEGNDLAQAGILLVEGAFRGLTQATVSLTRDIYAGQRGAAVSAKALGELGEQLGTAMQGVGLAVAALGLLGTFVPVLRVFGVTINLANRGLAALGAGLALLGIGVKASAEFNKIAAEQNDKLYKGITTLSQGAVGVAGGMDGLRQSLQLAGVSVAESEGFFAQLAAGANKLAFFGVTTGQAAQQFVRVSGDLRKSNLGRELELLGIQSEEQRELVMGYMSQQARLGRAERQSTQQLIQGSAQYAKELDQLAQLTGTTRKEQQEMRERQLTDERFRSAIVAARNRGDQAELDRLERARQLAAAVEAAGDRESATGILQIAAARGALTTPEAVAAEMTFGVNQVLNSQVPVLEALGQLVEQGRISQARFADIQAITGTIQGFQANVVSLDDVITRLGPAVELSRRTGESLESILKREAEQRARDKTLAQNVDAARTQQNAALTMDSVVSTYNYSAKLGLAASQAFDSAVKLFARTVGAKPVAGGLLGAQARETTGADYGRRAFGAGGRPSGTVGDDYLSRIAQLESGGRNIGNVPRAGQQATSAFGLYQITESTFRGLVANAPPGSPLKGKTFEDMKTDVNLQTEAMKQLTTSNEQLLARRGLSTSDAAKYMAHMMGYPTAARILEAPGNTPLNRLVRQDWLEKNNLQHYRTAGDLRKHFDDITGGGGYRFGGIAQGPQKGYLAQLHGTEAVVPLPTGKSIPVDFQGIDIDVLMRNNVMAMQMARDVMPNLAVLSQSNTATLATSRDMQQRLMTVANSMNSDVGSLQADMQQKLISIANTMTSDVGSLQVMMASIRTDISRVPQMVADERLGGSEANSPAAAAQMRAVAEEIGRQMSEQFRSLIQSLDSRTVYSAGLLEQLVGLQRNNNQTAQRLLQASVT